MCHPVAMMAFTVLQAGAQHMGQEKAARATHKYKVEQQRLTVASAADAARHQYQGLLARSMQAKAAATQDVNNQLKAYQSAQGRARVSAAAGGLDGMSVDEVGMDFAQQFVAARTSRLMNLSWEEEQLMASAQGIYAQQRGRVEGTTFAPIARPSPLATFSQMGAGMANVWAATSEHKFWGA